MMIAYYGRSVSAFLPPPAASVRDYFSGAKGATAPSTGKTADIRPGVVVKHFDAVSL